MGAIYLVRHGQAHFGSDHYDRLTETGFLQGRILGRHFRALGVAFDHVVTGSLQRQRETAEAILEGLETPVTDPVFEVVNALDEYFPDAVIHAHRGALPIRDDAARRRDPAVVREHFKILRDALIAWAEGQTEPAGMPAWREFQDGAAAAVRIQAAQNLDRNVLIVSSGGPISAIVCDALSAPPRSAVEMNLRIRNASVTEFQSTPKRAQLISFNGIAHLEIERNPALITYA